MLDCYDQDELLAYIEDALAPEAAAALRKQLEADPPVAELIEAMRRDRELLRSEAAPELPIDLAARLESMLVRPMLIDALDESPPVAAMRPGRERRRHRHQRQMRALRRLAVAAAIAIVAVGGVLAAYNSISFDRAERVAMTEPEAIEQNEAIESQSRAALDAWDTEGATIHHHLPAPAAIERLVQGDPLEGDTREFSTPSTVVAEFVLVVQCDDRASAEEAMTRIAGELNKPVALVQNFSYDEARRLERAWLMAGRSTDRGDARAGHDAIASSRYAPGEQRFGDLADRVREQSRLRPGAPEVSLSKQFVGERDAAASFSQQLAFSSRGATHTISVPADQLQELFSRMALVPRHTTWLQRLAEDRDNATIDIGAGFNDRAAVQQMLSEIRELGGDVIVHLPVIVEHAR